jgi:hypothetical protein
LYLEGLLAGTARTFVGQAAVIPSHLITKAFDAMRPQRLKGLDETILQTSLEQVACISFSIFKAVTPS